MRFKSISSDLLVTIVTLVAALAAVTAAMAFQEEPQGFERYNQASSEPYAYPLLAYNTTRVSVASDGSQANSYSYSASISADGRYVAFTSEASNLAAGDTNGRDDIFVHDRQTGEVSRVSVASDGSQANSYSYGNSMSADGRYVAFSSAASNLVAGDTNGVRDIFVHDRQTRKTARVSVASDGSQANDFSIYPSISADGRYVAFGSSASNLAAGDTNGVEDVFVHDRQTGETNRVSVASGSSQADSSSEFSTISADGRYVAFVSRASNLIAGDTNDEKDIFIHDRQTGETSRISLASDGTQANSYSYGGPISADGRYVVFQSSASNLVDGDTNGVSDVFVHDRQSGETSRVSVHSDGPQANDASYNPSISADGRYVAFSSYAYNLVPGDINGEADVFVHDRQTGETIRTPSSPPGFQANDSSYAPSISGNGRVIAFTSQASNLVAGDTNGSDDVFVYENLGKLTPADGATTVSLSPTLSWQASASAASYEYCYSSVPGPCINWVSTGNNPSVTLSGLAANYTYYWQARAVNPGGVVEADNGIWWSFTTAQVIPSPWIGSASIQSDQNIVAVGRPHLGSEVASYIGATAGSTTQYVPMLFKGAFSGGTYNAALYIQNVSASAATLNLEFTDSSGAVVYTKADTLDPHASKGYWLPAEAGLPNGFAGGVKVTSTQPILAVGRPHIGAQVMTYNGMSSGATTAWLPMFFKNGFGSYNTALYVQNLTGSSANLTIQYINLNGTVACTDNDTLGANASKGYWSLSVACDTGSLPSGFVGGVKVTSSQNILAVGRAHLGTQITTYNGFPGGATSAYVPMLFRNAFAGGFYDAALYLQNVSGSSATVAIEYLNSSGAVAATQNVTLAANAISSIWLPGVAGLPDGFAGGARISSTQEIIAVGRPHLGSEIATYNGAPAGSLNVSLPMLFKNAYGGSYNTAFYVQNTSGSAANVDISFYDSAGVLSCVKSVDLAAGAIEGFWMPTVTCEP